MSAPRNRRRVIRKLAQAARERSRKPSPPARSDAVEPIVEDDAPALASAQPTELLPAMGRAPTADSRGETEPADGLPSASSIAPDPPDRIRFLCPCGAPMTATRETYDGRMKCDACGSVLLVALIYEARKRAWAIEALRTKL